MCKAYFELDIKYAKDLQLKHRELIQLLFKEVNPMPVKDAMNILGFDVGTPRLPLTSVSEHTHELLKNKLLH